VTVKNVTQSALLYRIERFYDAVPRREAEAESHGSLTLFVRPGLGWPFYARPTLGGPLPDVAGIQAVRARQRELGVPEAFEWVDEVTPGLIAVAQQAGLPVRRCPLMLLDTDRLLIPGPPPGHVLKVLDAADDDLAERLADVRAVASVGFGSPGTSAGPVGPAERDAVRGRAAAVSDSERSALRAGAVARAVVLDRTGAGLGALCAGSYQRSGDVVEIVGVATLPSARRRGLAGALTAALAVHALDHGAALVFLSAGDDDVARTYARLGFERVATACIAEPG
jgi:ribosomal protein S18 acetylase RimI-like enzyme